MIIDTRPKEAFSNGHVKGAFNLQDGEKFETWLGSVISPHEAFYLLAETDKALDTVIKKTAKIGYEINIKAALSIPPGAAEKSPALNISLFKAEQAAYTIIDARNRAETTSGKLFAHSLAIPLPELRERIHEIPTDKPIAVHCAAGYRSAAAASIIAAHIENVPVYDLGEDIKGFDH